MDSSGYILLLIVAVCVIALIYIARKQKALDETPETEGKPASREPEKSSVKEEEKPSGPPQILIYEFTAKNTKRLCPFCDGENSDGARVCMICGRDL